MAREASSRALEAAVGQMLLGFLGGTVACVRGHSSERGRLALGEGLRHGTREAVWGVADAGG